MMNALRWRAMGIIAFLFALDRSTKVLIERRIGLYDTIPVIPNVFNLVHTKNRGAAFGILNDAAGEWRLIFLVAVSLGILALIGHMLWQATRESSAPVLRLALTLIFGGALGNLFDRLAAGEVTDFLQVFLGSYEWPSFNVADSAISTGAVLLAFDMMRPQPQAQRNQ
jgi:signal peptidase II